MRRVMGWIDERLQVSPLVRSFVDRKVPGNIGWAHTLGSATLIFIVVQFATGIVLTLSYVPSPDAAYESVLYIDQTPFGGLVRGIHHWSAGLLVVLIGLHALRVFIWAAHRYPRELTWVVGALLFFIVLGFAFTGYLLPWDQKAYWATVVGTNIAGSVPFIGQNVLEFLRGGDQLGAVTLARFYGVHVWVLPAALLLLVAFHLFAVVRQGIAASPRRHPLVEPVPGEPRRDAYRREYEAEKAAGRPFWVSLLKDAILAAVLLVVVFGLAIWLGAPLEPKANPNATGYAPRPEWYFLDLFQLLWFFTGSLESLLIFAFFTLAAVIFLLVPWIDRSRQRWPTRRPVAMALSGLVVLGVLGLTVVAATSPPPGVVTVPPVGGMSDQQLAGLQVYNAEGCSSCHEIRGVGGSAGPSLTRAGFRWEADTIRLQIVTPQDEQMPAFDGLTPQQLDDLVAFLASLK
ncbi:MAG TPA: cytochrome b N-terminal domain-containing protein [Candidatus Limnocylindria bacterium]